MPKELYLTRKKEIGLKIPFWRNLVCRLSFPVALTEFEDKAQMTLAEWNKWHSPQK